MSDKIKMTAHEARTHRMLQASATHNDFTLKTAMRLHEERGKELSAQYQAFWNTVFQNHDLKPDGKYTVVADAGSEDAFIQEMPPEEPESV